MWGDRIARDHAPLALGMDLRVDGEPTGRVVVFVHGLCETDAAWRLGGGPTYGDRLREDLGHTPVYARYNTGRHISDNGRTLAAALEALVDEWPVEVEELVLVGHSMGGLVARSACHYAERDGLRWTAALRHVVCLGSPHLGAPLERAAARGSHWLAKLPEAAPLARLLTARSAGVKDLRYGACLDEDWEGIDPDAWGPDGCGEVPFLPSATYSYVGATLDAREGLAARADRRRRAGAVPERVRRRPGAPARVRARARDAPRRRQPPPAAQPPARLRAAAALAHWLARRRRPTGRASASSRMTPSSTAHSTGSSKRGSCRR